MTALAVSIPELPDLRAELSPDALLELAAAIAVHHPHLEGQHDEIVTLLRVLAHRRELREAIAGGPRRLVTATDLAKNKAEQTVILGGAMYAIWKEPMLDSGELAVALGAKRSNREKARLLRERSQLLGLPRGRGYYYPAFQVDIEQHTVKPTAATINEILGAASDPWGVASWWFSPNGRVGSRPVDMVDTWPRVLVEVAQGVLDPLG